MYLTVNQRLRTAREALGLTLREFSMPLRRSHQAVSDWETGRTPISAIVAEAIEKHHGISIEWLLAGDGEMFVRKVDNDANSVAEDMTPYTGENPILLPLIPLAPSAGPGTDIYEEPTPTGFLPFDPAWLHLRVGIAPRHLFLTEIVGDSMVPLLNPNDLILVDKSAASIRFRDGIWVFRLDDAIHIKRVQHLGAGEYEATSANPAYRPFMLREPYQFIGRMIKLVWVERPW